MAGAKKAVVFDMDGVLLDTEKLYRMHWKKAGMEMGRTATEMDSICEKVAGGTKDNTKREFAEAFGPEFPYMECRKRCYEMMGEYIEKNGVELKPFVKEIFAHLKENRIKIALATSTAREMASERLKSVGIYDDFDAMVFGDMIEHGKPAPDIYLKACELLNVAPEDAIGVEDSINGVHSCHAAGLYTVMVIDLIKPTKELFPYCNQIYASLKEMLPLV